MAGISLKTQELYVIVFLARYLDLFNFPSLPGHEGRPSPRGAVSRATSSAVTTLALATPWRR